jgi:hypothetical protein
VADPDVTRWAESPPVDAASSYRTAAAVAAVGRRAHAAALLEGLGAAVVDGPPELLAPRLADAYLRVKAAGRL